MPPLSLLIKPASGSCNLNCSYCFYANVTDHRDIKNYGMMTESTMKKMIDRAFDYAEHQVTFAFQGGEPTLIGLPYFEKFVAYVKATNPNRIKVNYALQTNGILIDEAYAKFFHDNHFLLGVSLDGPKDVHDMNRKDHKSAGSYKQVMTAIKILEEYKVDFNILSVVNNGVAKHPQKVYNYFRKEGFQYLQFIPCLDELGKPHGSNPYALVPKDYANFLCKLFDLWYKDFMNGQRISIRTFDNILQILLGYPPESCDMMGVCSANLVVEADGSVYPCDFYVLDEWRLGDVEHASLMELANNEVATEFIDTSKVRHDECNECVYMGVCRGGCRRHKSLDSKGPLELNYFCETYKTFYGYTLERFKEMARILYKEMR